MTLPFRLEVRVNRIRVLLATRNDYLIEPHRSEEQRQLTPSKFVPCAGLGHSGKGCSNCGGSGTRRRRADDPGWDAYTRTWLATSEQPEDPRYMTPQELDAAIEHLERDAAEREGREDEELAAKDELWWERARNQRDRSGSYNDLERVLEQLYSGDVQFLELYQAGLVRRTPAAERREHRLLLDIEQRMPRRIMVPQWAYDRERDKLALYIRTLSDWKVSDIAREVGISQRRVKQLRALKVAL
jgi:hypothetical protein